MNSDNYEFSKSSHPQSVSQYTSYTDKQWDYVPDINNSVYSNNSGLSLVTWDLTSIYNSSGLSDASDLFLAIPLVMCATVSAAGVTIAPGTMASYALCSLKSNYQNLIHQIDITSTGKQVQEMQPFVNVYENFKLLSSMSATDLQGIGPSLNINGTLDNEKSVLYNTVAAAALAATNTTGVGLCNNRVFGANAPGAQTVAQNANQYNNAIYNRASRIVDTSTNSTAGIFGTGKILTTTQLNAEYKPYFGLQGNVLVWYDVGLIPLKYICDVIDKMGLVKKLDIGLRVYFNTGSIQINVVDAAANTTGYGAIASTTFSNTCPLTINYLNGSNASGGLPATTTLITAGLFIAKAPTTFGATTPITIAVNAHSMPSCRCYYSQVKLDPQKMLTYIEENRSKSVVYESLLFNQYTGLSVNGTFSQLVQSGIKNPVAVVIIPMISTAAVNAGAGGTQTYNQYQSPYDTFPATYSPLSLTNISVKLGGVSVMNSTLYYTYESFLEQVSLAETLTSTDIGIQVGLINQSWWEQNRVYYVDLSRGREADKATYRNLTVSFNNNSNVAIDTMIFTIYLDKFTVDVETGIVVRG